MKAEKRCSFALSSSGLTDSSDLSEGNMVRTVIAVLFVVVYCIISVPILLVETVIRKFNKKAAELSMLRIVQVAFRILLFICGTKITVLGEENLPRGEAVLFVGNHTSFFDTIISYSHMKDRCGYIAKDSLAHIPLLSWNMRFLLCLFLKRDDLKQGLEIIHKAIDYVKEGISVFIYPEGTRNKTGDSRNLGPFHRGSFKIAQRTECSIIPVAFTNADDVFERHFPKVKKTHVIVEYGTPVPYTSLSRDEQRHIEVYFHDIMQEMLNKNQELI